MIMKQPERRVPLNFLAVGQGRHSRPSCRQEIPVGNRYLEFVCVYVRMGRESLAILPAQPPDRGHYADVPVPAARGSRPAAHGKSSRSYEAD